MYSVYVVVFTCHRRGLLEFESDSRFSDDKPAAIVLIDQISVNGDDKHDEWTSTHWRSHIGVEIDDTLMLPV